MKLKQKYLIFVLSILGLLVVAFGVYHLQKSKEASLKAPVPSAIVQEVPLLAQDGEHPEILKAHVQFHESVLKSDQTLQEIGFPQNLEKWFELGKEYPKALEALRETRNKDTLLLMEGDPDVRLYNVVRFINIQLEERNKNVELFKWFEAVNPEFLLNLVGRSEGMDIPPNEPFFSGKLKSGREVSFSEMKAKFWVMLDEAKLRDDEAVRRNAENEFASQVLRQMAIFYEKGQPLLAAQLREEALLESQHPAITNAIRGEDLFRLSELDLSQELLTEALLLKNHVARKP